MRSQRFACIVAHRRAGKTFACVQDLIRSAMSYTRKGPPCRFGYIAPTRDQAKDIAWQYLQDYSAAIPGVKFNQADLSITYPNGSMVRLYSGDSYDRMRGLFFDGVVIDEPADIDPSAWPYVIMPCLSDYQGWATFIGTCKGKNAFYRTFHNALKSSDWLTLDLKASETGIIPESELKILRENMTPEAYRQEYENDWTIGIPGAVYAADVEKARQEGRVCRMPVDGNALVHTAWDLGSPLNTVVWYFQIIGKYIRLLACDRNYDETIVERVSRMKARGWNYGNHYLPHDAAQTDRTGRTLAGELHQAGLNSTVIVPKVTDIWHGINHAKQMFPTFEFREPDCDAGLEALEAYHTRQLNDGVTFRDEPEHDWSSHTADALRVLAEAHAHGMIKFSHAGDPLAGFGAKPRRRGVKPIRVGG